MASPRLIESVGAQLVCVASVVALLAGGWTASAAPTAAPNPSVVAAMEAELTRTAQELKRPGRAAPYYVGYWVVDYEQLEARASLGAISVDRADSGRRIRVELRVGDHQVDNSNFASSGLDFGVRSLGGELGLAVQTDGVALRRDFWLASDQAYRTASETLDQKKAQRASEVEVDKRAPDFSQENPRSIVVNSTLTLPRPRDLWVQVQKASEVFSDFPEVHDSEVSAQAWIVHRTFVSSEGVRSYEPTRLVRYSVDAWTQAPDGMPLRQSEQWFGTVETDALSVQAERIGRELTQLRHAELVEDYSGPILFEGKASTQIIWELLSLSLSGTPGQGGQDTPLARRLGKRVFPENFALYDDPTLSSLDGHDLLGSYAFDDEGVPAQRVSLVESGRLKSLLMSRTPRQEIAHSNGHGRSGLSGWAKAGIGNLVLDASRGISAAGLRARLLRAVKDEGAAYGLVVKKLDTRGFSTGGISPPSPQRLFRLYPDGREELVRGAAFGEMSVRDLRDILASGRDSAASHFVVTWPSGLESVSTVVGPSLLFEEVEVNRPKAAHARPPALPRPPLK